MVLIIGQYPLMVSAPRSLVAIDLQPLVSVVVSRLLLVIQLLCFRSNLSPLLADVVFLRGLVLLELGLDALERHLPSLSRNSSIVVGSRRCIISYHPVSSQLVSNHLISNPLESTRLKSSHLESSRLESSRLEPSRLESSRLEPSRLKSSRLESSRLESSRLKSPFHALLRLSSIQPYIPQTHTPFPSLVSDHLIQSSYYLLVPGNRWTLLRFSAS